VVLVLIALSVAAWNCAAAASGEVTNEIRRIVTSAASVDKAPSASGAAVASFYERRGYLAYWLDGNEPGGAANVLLAVLRAGRDDGLPVEVDSLAAELAVWNSADAARTAELDVALTGAFRDFGWRLANGSSALRSSDPHWHIAATPVEPLSFLGTTPSATAVRSAVNALRPPHSQYAALRAALNRYRAIMNDGGWPTLPSGPTLDPGMVHGDVAVLRHRLAATGDLAAARAADGDEFDASVEEAVLRFQRRHGLDPDGRVGRDTRQALNVPAEQRVAQLAAALERWRWMPRELGDRYVYVNIPQFELHAVADGRATTEMRVIVGRRDRPTPAFAGTIDRFIVNPMWYVPNLIARADLLPKQRRDPEYFTSHHIRVFADAGHTRELDPAAIDWSAVPARPFPYFLRQDPGPGNSLGRLKFLVLNPFDIYLHDTPARSLFERRVRAFSSGCIRLEDAPALAAFLMNDPAKWSPERVRSMMDEGTPATVRPPTSVPVYIAYFTAWVDADGTVQLRDDLYDRDAGIAPCGCTEPAPECG
jgi:murein L,D-transpeptidase YcbB/YkuD